MTKHVPPEQTGQLLGASGLLHALSRVVAPTLFNGIYAATVGSFTQTVFVCLTATFGLAFVISWLVKPHGKLLVTTLQSCSRVLIAIQSIYTKTTLSIQSIRIEQFPRPIYRLGRTFLSFRALDTLMLRLCILIFLDSVSFSSVSLHFLALYTSYRRMGSAHVRSMYIGSQEYPSSLIFISIIYKATDKHKPEQNQPPNPQHLLP